jgi:dienelactone hydrolase
MIGRMPDRGGRPAAACGALLAFVAGLLCTEVHAQVQDCAAVKAGQAEAVVFAAPAPAGGYMEVQGALFRPPGGEKAPALIFLHGWGGIGPPRCFLGATELFTRLGYVVLVIDSQSQVMPSGTRVPEVTTAEQANHVVGALSFLAALPEVDGDRVGVVAWSTGGLAAIKAIAGPEPRHKAFRRLRAAAVMYPICPANIDYLMVPLLILIGEEDREVSVQSCRNFDAAVVTGNSQLVIYAGAKHAFDAPWSPDYRPAASADAYARMRRHLEARLGPGG